MIGSLIERTFRNRHARMHCGVRRVSAASYSVKNASGEKPYRKDLRLYEDSMRDALFSDSDIKCRGQKQSNRSTTAEPSVGIGPAESS